MLSEVEQADKALVETLAVHFKALLKKPLFIDAISGHMPTDEISQARVSMIKDVIEKLAYNKIT